METKTRTNHKSPRANPGVKESRPLLGYLPARLVCGHLVSGSPATCSGWGLPGPMPTVLPVPGAHLAPCSIYVLLSSSIKLLLPPVIPRGTESCPSAPVSCAFGPVIEPHCPPHQGPGRAGQGICALPTQGGWSCDVPCSSQSRPTNSSGISTHQSPILQWRPEQVGVKAHSTQSRIHIGHLILLKLKY